MKVPNQAICLANEQTICLESEKDQKHNWLDYVKSKWHIEQEVQRILKNMANDNSSVGQPSIKAMKCNIRDKEVDWYKESLISIAYPHER